MDVPYIFDSVCPWCGVKNEVNRGIGHDEPPSPGDVSICFECTQLGIYDDEMKMRKPSAEELVELSKDQDIIAGVFALMALKARRDA